MKNTIATLILLGSSSLMLISCTNTQVGTAGGAALGAGVRYAVSGGSGLGTAIGAGAGALIGNSIGQEQDRRDYYYGRPYYYY
ncbi:MAG: glycine zipper domain-containing protein [Gammaproteobacteria bacterium]|nr:glycine zipper domain-containing protein [Gammaproteobacteria bacterium]